MHGTADRIDLAVSYSLRPGTRVIQRPGGTVQIGTESPWGLMLRRAPDEALDVLRRLDGAASLGDVLAASGAVYENWLPLLDQLAAAGLLVPLTIGSAPGPGDHQLAAEHQGLAQRYGGSTAGRLLQARADALVVVRGDGRTAGTVADLLAASGVGHVHHERPDRTSGGARSGRRARRITAGPSSPSAAALHQPSRVDGDFEARTASAPAAGSTAVRDGPPAAHQHPNLLILATGAPQAPWEAAALVRQGVPHLPIGIQLGAAVVGPLVLPGRSTCLLCVLHHRSAADRGWPAVEAALRREPVVAPGSLAAAAATLAVMDGLTFLDGQEIPATVDGTIEWRAGDLAPRRRSWSRHPDCDCTEG